MSNEPWFWRDDSLSAKAVCAALAPLAYSYSLASNARRRFTTPWRATTPVICVGNASVGGSGKTPFALMLCELLKRKGQTPHFLSRGYGGAEKGPVRVDPGKHSASDVGDEPLLLARHAPTWVSRSKRTGAEAAITAGADVIIMDDGFQNPTIAKDFSILLVDEKQRRNNGRIFPAGPMREPLATAQARADIVIDIVSSSGAAATDSDATHTAWLEPDCAPPIGRILAFCGIANPDRFFSMLQRLGFDVADAIAFPDHYQYTPQNIEILKARAAKMNTRLMTTEKDLVRIVVDQRETIETLAIRMCVSDPETLTASMMAAIEKRRER